RVAEPAVQPREEAMPITEEQQRLDRERQPRPRRHLVTPDARDDTPALRPHPPQPLLDPAAGVDRRHAVAGSVVLPRPARSDPFAWSPQTYASVSTRRVSHQYEKVKPGQMVRFTPF